MADDDGQTGTQANPGQSPASLFTQDQVNHFQAEAKRGALGGFFKDLGFDKPPTADELKAAFTDASEFKKLKDGKKDDVERLTGELATVNEQAARVPELETVITRQRIAHDMDLPSKVWHFVEGKTDDEIKTSVKSIRGVLGMSEEPEASGEGEQQQSGPRPPRPTPGQGTGGGGKPKSTLSSGRDLYASKHPPITERAAE